MFGGCFLDDKWMMGKFVDASLMMINVIVMLLSRNFISG